MRRIHELLKYGLDLGRGLDPLSSPAAMGEGEVELEVKLIAEEKWRWKRETEEIFL